MRNAILSLSLTLLVCGLQAQSWDTLKVMTYNLLYYGEITSYCTASNNDINDKDVYFKTIAKHVKPDLLLVNEMGASIVYADRILENVLNVDGVTRYQRAPIQNNSFSDLVNGVFYDKRKLKLHQQDKLSQASNGTSIVRVIDIVTFYYRDPLLEAGSDTVFLYLVGMHLKAGSSNSDQSARDLATSSLMEYLVDNYPPGNIIVAGDMNMSSSSEQGFQNFLSTTYDEHRLEDPLISGGWSSSQSFAYAHTQSTHTSSGCHSGGGMDDRFDIILLSREIMTDTGSVRYVEDSYEAVGNDGLHYNQSLIQGTNNSVPSSVLSALYEMSDHLPVTLDLRVKLLQQDTDTIPEAVAEYGAHMQRQWDVKWREGAVVVHKAQAGDELVVTDVMGRVVFRKTLRGFTEVLEMPLFSPGMYVLTLSDGSDRQSTKFAVD